MNSTLHDVARGERTVAGCLPPAQDAASLAQAVHLKADLLETLRHRPTREWGAHLRGFVDALADWEPEQAGVRVALLLDLAEQVHRLAGLGSLLASSGDFGLPDFLRPDLPTAALLGAFERGLLDRIQPSPGRARRLSPTVQRATEWLEQCYAESITVVSLARLLGESPASLRATFHRETGATIHAYLTTIRLRRAVDLIRRGEKIELVGSLVGYRSKKNFYRQFQACYGVTPGAFRQAAERPRPPAGDAPNGG